MCWDNPHRGPAGSGPASTPQRFEASYPLPNTPGYSPPQGLAPWVSPQQASQAGFPKGPAPWLPPQQSSQAGYLSYSHLFALKQPLAMGSLAPPSPLKPSPQWTRGIAEDEPLAKRQTMQFNGALVVVEEDEEEGDVTEEMPDECLAQIFGFLDAVKDRMACAIVCRRWLHVLSLSKKQTQHQMRQRQERREAADQRPSTRHEPHSKGEDGPTAEATTGLARTVEGRSACDARLMSMAVALWDQGGLEKLVVRGNRRADAVGGVFPEPLPLTASGFLAIAQASPKIRSVAIWDCDWLDDETITAIARHCHDLEKLDILNCPRLSDKSLISLARGCPRLSSLALSGCRMVTDRGLSILPRGCKQLTSLSLSSCPYIQGKGIAAIASACKQLTSLKLAGTLGVTDEGFKVIGESAAALVRLRLCQLSRLTEGGLQQIGLTEGFMKLSWLSVSACPGLTSVALEAISKGCSVLKSMSLVGCPNVADGGVLLLLQNAGGLESLSLQSLPGISRESARHALEHGRHLRSLTISGCPGLQDNASGVSDWMVGCPDLNSLKVSHCKEVGDRCLKFMGRAGATLASLDLCGLPQAGDSGVMAFLDNSSVKLCSVDLSGCAQVTDRAVAAIAERCGESLRSLNLDGCTRVSDRSLRAIASDCAAIEDLDLSRCDVSDRGLKVLLGATGHSLVNLSLAGCVKITDRSVEEILESCCALSGLNLKNCEGLSRAAVERLKQHSVAMSGPTCLFIDP